MSIAQAIVRYLLEEFEDEIDPSYDVVRDAEAIEGSEALDAAILKLNPNQREVVAGMRNGKSISEIAKETGISSPRVSQLAYSSERQLVRILRTQGYNPRALLTTISGVRPLAGSARDRRVREPKSEPLSPADRKPLSPDDRKRLGLPVELPTIYDLKPRGEKISQGLARYWTSERRRQASDDTKERIRSGRQQHPQSEGEHRNDIRYSPSAQDAAYLAAVESGDMETAQKLVDEAAKGVIEKLRGKRTEFVNGIIKERDSALTKISSDLVNKSESWYQDNEPYEEGEDANGDPVTIKSVVNGLGASVSWHEDKSGALIVEDFSPFYAFGDTEGTADTVEGAKVHAAELSYEENLQKMKRDDIDLNPGLLLKSELRNAAKMLVLPSDIEMDKVIMALTMDSTYFQFDKILNRDEEGNAGDTERIKIRVSNHAPSPFREEEFGQSDYQIALQPKDNDLWFDKKAKNWNEALDLIENHLRELSQIKSADPITYDDAGNVIPLSQRFQSEGEHRNDIRYSPSIGVTNYGQ